MSLSISIQGVPDLFWTKQLSSAISVRLLKQQFCRDLALPLDSCVLTQEGSVLPEDQVMGGTVSGLQLQATAKHSIAFSLWNSLRTAKIKMHSKSADIWMTAFNSYATPEAVSYLGFDSVVAQKAFARLPPSQSVPADILSGSSISVLPNTQRQSSAEPLLWAVKLLLTFNEVPAGLSCAKHCRAIQEDARLHIPLQQHRPAECNKFLFKLNWLMLMFKLATLLACVNHEAAEAAAVEEVVHQIIGAMHSDSFQTSQPASAAQAEQESEFQLIFASILANSIQDLIMFTKPSALKMVIVCLQDLKHFCLGLQQIPQVSQGQLATCLSKAGLLPALVKAVRRPIDATPALAVAILTFIITHLPARLVLEPKKILLDLQAHFFLCNLVCPAFTKPNSGRQDLPEITTFSQPWGAWARTHYSIETSIQAAHLVAQLLEDKQFLPRDQEGALTGTLPTPSAAGWHAIEDAVCKLLVGLQWQKRAIVTLERQPIGEVEGALRQQAELGLHLMMAVQGLLLGHVHNMELDLQQILKRCNHALFMKGALQPSSKALPLAKALLLRMGQRPSELCIDSKPMLPGLPHSCGITCPGCSTCCEADWEWKSQTCNQLLVVFCGIKDLGSLEACFLAEALYGALDSLNQCRHILLQRNDILYEAQGVDHMSHFFGMMDRLDHDRRAQLDTQLNVLACLIKLCAEEVRNLGQPGKPNATPWLDRAQLDDTFQQAVPKLIRAFKAPAPWALEQCVALARALHTWAGLQQTVPDTLLINGQLGKELIEAYIVFLDGFPAYTSNQELTMQLLSASMAFTSCTAIPAVAAPLEPVLAEKLFVKLATIWRWFPTLVRQTTPPEPTRYPSFGMPLLQSLRWDLHICWLAMICDLGPTPPQLALFAREVLPHCKAWFGQLVAEWVQQEDTWTSAMHLGPYFNMWNLQGQLFATYQLEESRPDTATAKAMLQYLYLLITRTAALHNAVRKGQQIAVRSILLQAEPAQTSSIPQTSLQELPCTTRMLDKALNLVATMCKAPSAWAPVLAQVAAQASWAARPDMPATLKQHLTQDRPALRDQAQRIEACFYQAHSPSNAAAELTVIEQLLAEEEAGQEKTAAQAAAKKAKKQKQKAKKAQQQQQLAEDQPTQQLPDRHPAARSEQQQPQPHAQHADHSEDIGQALAGMHISAEPALLGQAHATGAAGTSAAQSEAVGVATSSRQDASGSANRSQPQSCVPPGPDHDDTFLQDLFCCPLTKGMMRDPVIAADGHSYERAALEAWLAHHSTSPVTGQPLPHSRILDNVLIKTAIARHREQQCQPDG